MSIFKIAVTGSAGSGKSLVCKNFIELGLTGFDCDQIAREVVEPGMQAYNEIVDLFGQKIVAKDKSLNRPALRKIIANNDKLRKSLEDIIHPAILNNLFFKIDKTEARGEKIVVVEIPLLFELGLKDRFDYIVTVAGDEEDLIARIMNRDNVSTQDAKDILNIQFSQKEKIEESDHVIWNTAGASDVKGAVDRLYQKIQKEYLT
jgi:dephospho-CoA kinase